jgi:hypothetical protein
MTMRARGYRLQNGSFVWGSSREFPPPNSAYVAEFSGNKLKYDCGSITDRDVLELVKAAPWIPKIGEVTIIVEVRLTACHSVISKIRLRFLEE